jgi:hypothetical protein
LQNELAADFAPERPRLGKAEMMRIGREAATLAPKDRFIWSLAYARE